MNKSKGIEEDSYKQLLILEELSRNGEVTQRDVSKNLGIALGLVNSYIKNLTSKGYITIASIPRKRFKYYLTPKGFKEMSSLTYRHLHNFTNLYRVARRDFCHLFRDLADDNVKKVVFCGADEVAEIAYLSLKDLGLDLVGVIDDPSAGEKFMGHTVVSFKEVSDIECDIIVITSFKGGDVLKTSLVDSGVKEKKICDISEGDWLKRFEG